MIDRAQLSHNLKTINQPTKYPAKFYAYIYVHPFIIIRRTSFEAVNAATADLPGPRYHGIIGKPRGASTTTGWL